MAEKSYVDQLIETSRYTQLNANRAGDVVASVNSLTKDGNKYRNQLFFLGMAGESFTSAPLTAPDAGANLMAIAESGAVFYTLDKDVDGAESESLTGVYRLPQRGEAQLALTFPGDIEHLEVRGRDKGETLVFKANAVAQDADSASAVYDDRKKQGVSAILHESFPTRFWDHDENIGVPALFVKTGDEKPRRVELPAGRFMHFSVDSVGRRALVTIKTVRNGVHERNSVYLVDLVGDEETRLIAEADEQCSYYDGAFCPGDTHAFIFREKVWLQNQSLAIELAVFDFETGELTDQLTDLDVWPDYTVWMDEKNFAFTCDYQGAGAVFRAEVNGASKQLTHDSAHYTNLLFTSGTLVALCDSHQHAPYPVRINEDTGEVKALENPPIAPFTAPGRLEKIWTTAEDGTKILSWLALPQDGDGPFPLVVFAHGGPWGSWNAWTFRWNPWALTQEGFAVLLPDPGISTGYGQDMIDRGGHSVGAEPYTDILACIDEVSQRDDIDASRSAFMGGSYGGYMTNWVAGQQGKRFKCYITHASIWNQEHMYSTTDNGGWHEWMWESEDNVRNTYSPHQFAQNIQAPMLVIHGDKDYRVPISQAHMLWFDLQRNSPELDHKFLYFPDEGHWILKPGNAKIWYETVIAYLKKHVLEQDAPMPRLLGQ
ncbi:MAG: prolyl oligopeptidase family serine peptidase [Rothia sp. (in: high G+C Gram-positive bacteria)]|nr:prolyl oligopeptidase family serine peptidase [Rothia sp. (in: high G+C Gram-positive bacteria)]